jgi:uncharacterized membrane protein
MRRHVLSAFAFLFCVISALRVDASWGHEHPRHLVFAYRATLLREADTQALFLGRDLNTRGEISGTIMGPVVGSSALYPHAAIWRRGQVERLPEVDGTFTSDASRINDRGDVIGSDQQWTVGWGAAWRDGVLDMLGTMEEEFNFQPTSLNNRGQVTVFEYLNRAFVVTIGSGNLFDYELSPAPAGNLAMPAEINDLSHVAGWDSTGGFPYPERTARAALWRDGTVELLGMLPGMTTSRAVSLNRFDIVVGVSSNAGTGIERAFTWRQGQLKALPLVHRAGGVSNAAVAINDWGQIVGNERTADGASVAVLWNLGRAFDLNALVSSSTQLGSHVTLVSALRINEWGQILASARDDRMLDTELTYLLTPGWEWR